ncbi:hypothetical protein [Vibrio cortegadensis]|uniref:hypothetical protein n=1 Tax=Vibrio cortegadensis TaxID=1328770 RepID=UPI0021C40B1F|nr:hypothetical protein [Vibrio cortegadensis]
MMESTLFNALVEWGISPQFLVLGILMIINIRNQNHIIQELSKGLRAVSDRVLVLETLEKG